MNRIGLIGCGLMGSGIAYSLRRKGHEVNILDYKNNKNVKLLSDNGIKFVSMSELVKNCEIIILCLSDAKSVENVCFSDNGLINLLSSENILIDTTTSHPKTTQKIYDILKDKNIKFADAPLTRSPVEAMQGKLNSLVGASEDTFKEIKPILFDFCENVIHIGDVGSGHAIKLLNNFICMSFTAVVEYGMFCGKKLNIDLNVLNKVMGLGSNYVSSIPAMLDYINNNNKEVLNFSIKNAKKDMQYFFELVDDSNSKKWFKPLYDFYENASNDKKIGKETLPFLYEFLNNNDQGGD